MTHRDQGSLFGAADEGAPLPERMRPSRLDDVVGHEDLLGPGRPLREAIEADRLHSLILWGPPGSGKTTIARLLATASSAELVQLSAVLSGVKDARRELEAGAERRRRLGQRTLLFIDEIHRYNKAQQDAFLPFVERGDVVLVGATTENPSFGVIGPLLSRCRVHRLSALPDEAVGALLDRALSRDAVLGPRALELDADARASLLVLASGDARIALGLLEVIAQALPEGASRIGRRDVEDVAQSRTFLHDKQGDAHYDLASAFIKSMRSSDPDAAIYWMTRMLEAGEDPLFICRRMVILAAEDVGLADPRALQVAVAAHEAFERLGRPEGEIPMAEACLYLASAPKSNAAYRALQAARTEVREGRAEPVPLHLRNAATALMRREGYGEGYRHAHDEDGGVTDMPCLPESLGDRRFYRPTARGHEGRLREWLERRRRLREEGAPAD